MTATVARRRSIALAALLLAALQTPLATAQTGTSGPPPKIEIRRQSTAPPAARSRKSILTMRTLAAPPSMPAQAAVPAQPAGPPPRRVVTIATDPRVGNWDADVEVDGLIVDIAPLDDEGYLVAEGAVAEVELFAPQRRDFALVPLSGGDTLELVERWTLPIEPHQYHASGARLQLPFGAIHPELHPEWTASWYGLVHVRLVVPGHGVFDDSRDGVRIRPWAPNRDRLEHKTGDRFLPTERLGRTD